MSSLLGIVFFVFFSHQIIVECLHEFEPFEPSESNQWFRRWFGLGEFWPWTRFREMFDRQNERNETSADEKCKRFL